MEVDPDRAVPWFSDTILASPSLRTDASGRAEVRLAAPGEPARWRITARAVSGDDRFGEARQWFSVGR